MQRLTGILLFAIACASIAPAQNKQTTNSSPTVVFVCEHGAARSIIATAEFNKLAAKRGLPYRAISRGTTPDPQFAPVVVNRMQEDGLAIPTGKPQLLSADDMKRADRVITLGCKVPKEQASSNKVTDWPDIAAPSQNYDAAHKDIAKRVQELIESIERERTAGK